MKRTFLLFFVALLFSTIPGCDCSDTTGQESNNRANNENNIDVDMPADQNEGCAQCRTDQECVETPSGISECRCPAGTSDEDGVCTQDTRCTPTTCNEHGSCMDADDGPECACELGWAGRFCGECDAVNGWIPDGQGGCTDDPCSTLDCGPRVCQVTDGTPECACPAGTHDDGMGGCEDDQECTPTTCNGQGTCDDSGDVPTCTCNEGWEAPNCQMCDEANGYHADGMGGCTTDPCLPNPCTDANASVCAANGTDFVCSCDPGYHDEQGTCVIDEVCVADSCSMQGTCDDSTGVIACMCNPGYTGPDCSACDAVAGYHPDGMGGCTTDPCLPNPCTTIANKTQCVAQGMAFQCECAAGYHPDGQGGCSDDPCVPDLCAAQNQACRVTNNMPECYTPTCNDNNPCTDDTLVNGSCVYTPVTDGSACSTGLCQTGEVCTSGVCGGGMALACDDANPCTDDSCNPTTGCVFTNDDTNVPDDGIACTTDTCSGGFASNTNDNANCDDGQFCTGVEVCAPSDPNADAQGCLVTSVPVAPPNPGPCATYGACDEVNDNFPLNTLGAGQSCNDGVWCTIGDTCNASGQCAGTPTASCGNPSTGECTTTTPIGSTIEISTSTLTTNITVNGQPLSSITGSESTQNNIYAVDVNTGTRHTLAYWYHTNSGLNITYADRVVAGVYDILYRRASTGSADAYVYVTDANDALPNGVTYLEKGRVINAGAQTLDLDIPTTDLTTNITVNGQPLSSVTGSESTQNNIYAVDPETGTRHTLAYWYHTSSGLNITYADSIVSGTYDILFRRASTGSADAYVYVTDANDALPNGVTYLQKNVTISGAAESLNIDIPTATLSTNITVNGAALSTVTGSESTQNNLYAVDKDTGTRHTIAYWYHTNSGLNITYADALVAGTYDILYRRASTGSEDAYVYVTDVNDALPNGVYYVQKDVVVSAGSQTLNIDIPTTTVNTVITVDGAPLANITGSESTQNNIYAVNRDTGTRHTLAYWYHTNSGLNITYADSVISGNYDILYRRASTGSADAYVYVTDANDALPNGVILLQENVNISGAADTVNIDIPVATPTVNITVSGSPLSSISGSESTQNNIYAVHTETGTRHTLAYWYHTNSGLNITYADRLIAGTYDILYRRASTGSEDSYVYVTDSNDALPNSVIVLQQNVVVPAGAQSIDADLPEIGYLVDITVNGGALSQITGSESTQNNLYLVPRSTGTRHTAAYWYHTNSGLNLTHGERFIEGVYDVLYRRASTGSADAYVYVTDANDALPNGVTYVAQCVLLD